MGYVICKELGYVKNWYQELKEPIPQLFEAHRRQTACHQHLVETPLLCGLPFFSSPGAGGCPPSNQHVPMIKEQFRDGEISGERGRADDVDISAE